MHSRFAGRFALIAIALATIGCDRVTKQAATIMLAGAPVRSYLGDTVRLAYAQNAGGFLSWGADWPSPVRTGVFTVGTCVLLLWLLAVAVKRRWSSAALLGITLFAAGASSNWIDRVLHGSVVDFLNVGIGPLRTGIFNVADVALILGVALVVFTEAKTARSLGSEPSDS
jgi:signal peptidase II